VSALPVTLILRTIPLNISRYEQRVLHVLAQGGSIRYRRDARGKVIEVDCFNRDGFRLADCSLSVFERLRKRRLIRSREGQPYRITREGLAAVRSQLDNR
jgi:hypothetical protein